MLKCWNVAHQGKLKVNPFLRRTKAYSKRSSDHAGTYFVKALTMMFIRNDLLWDIL